MHYFSVLMAVVAISLSFTLTSCEDKNGPNDEPKEEVNIRVIYSVELSDTWYQFCDIEMTYTSPSGNPKTETITMDRVEKMTLPISMIPDKVSLTVKAKPKAKQPDVVAGKSYSLERSFDLRVLRLKKEGEEDDEIIHFLPQSDKSALGGDAFKKYIQQERTLYNHSYTIIKE